MPTTFQLDGDLYCYRCNDVKAIVIVYPLQDGVYEIDVSHHGERQVITLTEEEAQQDPDDVIDLLQLRATILSDYSVPNLSAPALRPPFASDWIYSSLEDYATQLEYCRNLVSGLPVKQIVLPAGGYTFLSDHLRTVGVSPNVLIGGFELSEGVLSWRGILLVAAIGPIPRLSGTLDLRQRPFLYTNQAKVEMTVAQPDCANIS